MKNKENMHTNNPNMTHNTIIIRLVTLFQLLTYKGGKINKYWNNSEINTEIMFSEWPRLLLYYIK